MRIWTLGAAVLLCLAVGLTGCGDADKGGGETDAGTGSSGTPAASSDLPLTGKAWTGDAPDLASGVTAIAFFHPM